MTEHMNAMIIKPGDPRQGKEFRLTAILEDGRGIIMDGGDFFEYQPDEFVRPQGESIWPNLDDKS